MAMSWAVAARLVRRTGFGASGTQIDAVAKGDAAAYVRGILSTTPGADAGSKSTPNPSFEPVAPISKSATADQRKAHNQALGDQLSTLTTWWIRRMAATTTPFDEKLTFVWHDHFATSSQKVRDAATMLAQNQKLRTMGRGSFSTLAYAMLTDAAMLRWLDGQKNTKQAPNENLAREFMELMALGHGDGYTETDVREGARALTGWAIGRDGTARLVPARHDSGSKTVLGVTGNLDARGFCDAVLNRPASSPFVATSLWNLFVSPDAPSATTLAALSAAYGSKRDLSALLTAMFTSPDFAAAQGRLVIGPVDWLLGAVRALKVPLTEDKAVRGVVVSLRALGQLPFYPPNVSGWPSGQAWLSTAAADQRVQTAATLIRAGDLSAVQDASPAARLDATAHLLGVATWSTATAAALKPLTGSPPNLVATALTTPEYLTH